jgi:hypothetical protein
MLKVEGVSEEPVASISRVVEGESRNQREAGSKPCFTEFISQKMENLLFRIA